MPLYCMRCARRAPLAGHTNVLEVLEKENSTFAVDALARARLVVTLKQHIRLLRWRMKAGNAIAEREAAAEG